MVKAMAPVQHFQGQQKKHPKKQMKDWSTFMGLTLENPLGTSDGATCIFPLISALLRDFVAPDLLFLTSQENASSSGVLACDRGPSVLHQRY